MNLKELDSFKISDAITFHDKLNPKLWAGNKLRPEVKNQLEAIAQDFLQEMGIHDLDVRDMTISGSNAAYSYTDHSDIDLHILVNMNDLPNSDIYKELFNAKKSLYNDSHNITIHGVPVELYVENAAEPAVTLGEYSILNDKWLRIPTKRRANFDEKSTKLKYEKLLDIVQRALKSKSLNKIQKVLKKIKQYRQAGLDKGGEFGPENLAFKALRSQGWITKLYALRDKLHSEELTIETMYAQEDYDPNGPPPGPEFKPTMPAGTVKVDVSDVYDWYKLGQHISNLKGLGHHDFGKGPPSTIMAFGSEPEEHKYIKDLEKTGLTTTDIDPLDKNQPKGMKRQKVDPTYNVNEKINPNVAKKDFHAEKDIEIEGVGPLKLIAYNIDDEYPQQFKVDAITPDGKKIGYFRFVVHDYEPEPKYKIFSKFAKKKDPYILAGNVSVWSEYQKKGIATEVYKWVKSMGNDIRPSDTQTDAGKAMWRGFEKNQTIEEDAGLKYVTRLDATPIKDFEGNLRQYKHTDDWQHSGLDTGDDSYYKKRNLKTNTVKGLFAGDPRRTALYATGNAGETRYVEYTLNGQPVVYFDKKDLPRIRNTKSYLSVFDASKFRKLPTGEYFSENPGKPLKQELITNPIQYITDQGWIIRTTNDLDSEFKKAMQLKKQGKIPYVGAEGMDNADIAESASGYIPSNAQKNDPRFKTALTVDIKPDSLKKNAKAFGSKISRAGIPPTLNPSGKF